MADHAERRWELDAVRGLMLVLMTLTHLPTRFAEPAGQPFGFVSGAEGFVMLSGYMAGMVYSARARRDGDEAMQEAFFRRVLKIYACQVALLLFVFTVVAAIGLVGRQEAVTNLLSFYLSHPLAAVLGSLLLVYNPALLDILPLYIVFMLASPLLLMQGRRRGWGGVLAVSVGLWLASQFDLGNVVYDRLAALATMPLAYPDTGAFEWFAWQFLWVLGLWMGATLGVPGHAPTVFARWMVRTALVVALTGLVWRHAIGQTPFPNDATLSLLFDKWHIGPLRLINFLSLLLLAMHYGPGLVRRLPRPIVLERLGQASLPVFCAHLVVALTALAVYGEPQPTRPVMLDVALLVGGFAVLYAVALASHGVDVRRARRRTQRRARRTAASAAAAVSASGAG